MYGGGGVNIREKQIYIIKTLKTRRKTPWWGGEGVVV